MLSNEQKIIFKTKHKNPNDQILLTQFSKHPDSSIKYLEKSLKLESQGFNKQMVKTRKQSLQACDRKYHLKSGFNIHRKYTKQDQGRSSQKDEQQVSLILKRRINSESKASSNKFQAQKADKNAGSSGLKLNFAKKIIEDLKKQTFKMRKSSSRYLASKMTSKSMQLSEKKLKTRQKLVQNSMQKLKPSFNINEVKFFSCKKSMGKITNQAKTQRHISPLKSSKLKTIRLEDKIIEQASRQQRSDQILKRILKRAGQPLSSYSQYIKGSSQVKYQIKLNFLSHYLTISLKQDITAHIDFSSLKLLESINVCLIDIFSSFISQSKTNPHKSINSDIVKEYAGVYFQTYSKIKTQYIMCEVLFKNAKKKLTQYFLIQRIIFYSIIELCQEQQIIKDINRLEKILHSLQLSSQILATITQMLLQDSKNIKAAQDSLIDTFKSLRLTRELDKRLPTLRTTLESINLYKNQKTYESFFDLSGTLFQLLMNLDKEENSDILTLFKLEQFFNWENLMIPPLFYLPMNPSKPYTLIMDLDGTLIFYNQESRILKYRPYMDRFLQAVQKYFELIIFSSYPKERTDIIVKEIQRDECIFSYKLYKPHMVFQQGLLRKNVGYLGRSLQKIILIDDEEKNTQWLPSNSFKIKSFTGDKQDKQLLGLSDWLINMIQAQPSDVRGKIKKPEIVLEQITQIDEISSSIQASIQYMES